MFVIMKKGFSEEQLSNVVQQIKKERLTAQLNQGTERTVVAVLGTIVTLHDLRGSLEMMPGVEEVVPITKPYKLSSREFQPGNTVIRIGDVSIGGEEVVVMAGPCAVEGEEQIVNTARAVKSAGATILRGGAFKPSTSPYHFRGLGEDGLKMLAEAREETGLLIITEALSARDVELVARYTDIVQIGARNMQNFALLDEVGDLRKPVMLKRGMSATIQDWLLAAEYILSHGNHQLMLCERGIRTFEDYTRNTIDISAIPVIHRLSHLPIIADPSHGTGKWHLVTPVALAATAAGADGLIIEVHPTPDTALKDGAQSLTFENFAQLMVKLAPIVEAIGRKVASPRGR